MNNLSDHAQTTTDPNTSACPTGSLSNFVKTAAIMVVGIAAFYLLREHWNHLVGYWAYLILLACPLMHLFMHRRHGGHGHHGQGTRTGTGDGSS